LTAAQFLDKIIYAPHAEVAELADAVDSKSTALKSVPVRVRPSAPSFKALPVQGIFLCPYEDLVISVHVRTFSVLYPIVNSV
jgi:hypothetical protein